MLYSHQPLSTIDEDYLYEESGSVSQEELGRAAVPTDCTPSEDEPLVLEATVSEWPPSVSRACFKHCAVALYCLQSSTSTTSCSLGLPSPTSPHTSTDNSTTSLL